LQNISGMFTSRSVMQICLHKKHSKDSKQLYSVLNKKGKKYKKKIIFSCTLKNAVEAQYDLHRHSTA